MTPKMTMTTRTMTSGTDFHRNNLLGPDGVYEEFYKGDFKGHVFRGNRHSPGGIGHFDPYNAIFMTICAHGHQNTLTVPKAWIQTNAAGQYTGQFSSGAQTAQCSTCSRPLANRWKLVQGQNKLPAPTVSPAPSTWVFGGEKQYVE